MLSSISPTTVLGVTDASFEREVLQRDKPVLVDFWAQWCGPCHMISPVLKEIAAQRADSLVIRKINADENPTTVRKYRVMSMPTLLLFRAGEPVQAFVGARPKFRLLAQIDDALGL
jgi:thioredoxin 1